jgi:hypothetical protein
MIAPLIRFAKRIVVLIPGIAMAYVAVNDLFPAVDRHLPSDALAIFVTYAITAYVLIPALLRLTRLLFKPKHIPLYCTTPDGFASDPVNVGIVGTKDELIAAMTKAGWYLADERTLGTMFKLALSIILKQRYATAPFSSLYLFGRSQDIGFELPLDHNPRHRHHVRFWAASHTANPEHLDHVLFWRRFHRSNLSTGRVLWVGAASLDTGIGIIRHNAQLTHMIHPDTDAERELIIKQIKAANRLKKVRTVDLGSPYKLRNRVIMGYMKADGKMTIAELKK